MTLASILSRLRGDHGADRLQQLSREISQARENTRLNTMSIDSGDRALRRMSGVMRLLMETDSAEKTER